MVNPCKSHESYPTHLQSNHHKWCRMFFLSIHPRSVGLVSTWIQDSSKSSKTKQLVLLQTMVGKSANRQTGRVLNLWGSGWNLLSTMKNNFNGSKARASQQSKPIKMQHLAFSILANSQTLTLEIHIGNMHQSSQWRPQTGLQMQSRCCPRYCECYKFNARSFLFGA